MGFLKKTLGFSEEIKDLNKSDFIKNLITENNHTVVVGNNGKTIFIENTLRELTNEKIIIIERNLGSLKKYFNHETDFHLEPITVEEFDYEEWVSTQGKSTIFFGMHYSEEGVRKQLKFIETAFNYQIKNNNEKVIFILGEMRATDIINYSKAINSKSQSVQVFLLLKNIQSLNENFDPILQNVKTIVYFNEEPFAESNIENIAEKINRKSIIKEIKNLDYLESLIIQDNKIYGKCQITKQKSDFHRIFRDLN